MTVLQVLLALNGVAAIVLFLLARRLRGDLEALRARADRLDAPPAPSAELLRIARENGRVLSVHILNPMELAAQKHWVAGAAGRLSPGIVRQIVYKEAARIVAQELPKYGVVAEVRIIEGA
jgi:hypothetical protein